MERRQIRGENSVFDVRVRTEGIRLLVLPTAGMPFLIHGSISQEIAWFPGGRSLDHGYELSEQASWLTERFANEHLIPRHDFESELGCIQEVVRNRAK